MNLRTLIRITLLSACSLCLIAPTRSHAQDDTAAINKLVQSEVAAWNAHDTKAFSLHFASDGTFTNIIGGNTFGRPAFEEDDQRIFATIYKDSSVHWEVTRLKFLRPDVAVVDVDSHLANFTRLPLGIKAEPDGRFHCKILMTLVKEKGEWWIAAFHNVGVIQLPPPAAH